MVNEKRKPAGPGLLGQIGWTGLENKSLKSANQSIHSADMAIAVAWMLLILILVFGSF